ncbi:hypothetical protein QE152_g26052, partial [Popillia japonica]
ALLDHTTYRIIQLQADVIDTLSPEILQKLLRHCKWGCDGSSGQSVYKQKFTEDGKSDESIFYASLVPLQLIHNNHETDEATIVWKNPRPSSPRFCRPIRLQFLHEDVQSTRKEVTDIEQHIGGLAPYATVQNGKSISVTYCMSFTMIDGVDEDLIHRFHVILQVISSGYDIDNEKIKDYCVNTARLFVALLLVTSDPFISSIRKLPQRPAKSLHQEAIQLLKQPEVTRQETRNDFELLKQPEVTRQETRNDFDFDTTNRPTATTAADEVKLEYRLLAGRIPSSSVASAEVAQFLCSVNYPPSMSGISRAARVAAASSGSSKLLR